MELMFALAEHNACETLFFLFITTACRPGQSADGRHPIVRSARPAHAAAVEISSGTEPVRRSRKVGDKSTRKSDDRSEESHKHC